MQTMVKIEGMHCRSCEALLEGCLGDIDGVSRAQGNSRKGEVVLEHSKPLSIKAIDQAVREAGFSLGKDETVPLFSRNPTDYLQLAAAATALAILYIALESTGILNSLSTGSMDSALPSVVVPLLIGVTAGFSSCMALVGGLVLGVSASATKRSVVTSRFERFKPHLVFNLGRIVMFGVLGGVIGFVGSFFKFSPQSLGFLTLVVAVVMLVVGLQLVDISPRMSGISFALPSSFARFGKGKKAGGGLRNSFLLGGLTFFLPCGFTQAMQVLAVGTGSVMLGALTMSLFALGTTPGLLTIGGVASIIKGKRAQVFYKFVGVLVITLAFFNASNALSLTGIVPAFGSGSGQVQAAGSDPNVRLENGVQVVSMTQVGNGYIPNTFTIQKDVPVRWEIDSQEPRSCAASIYSQQLGIEQNLQAGKNVIEFTAKQAGPIQFSCWMGMYGGIINVVDGPGAPS